ncbi:hypothetical protein evm_006332 [Chilo suppressalis]|nr:hypothetical protein evm_006332 [Chilo suppressalis]
MVSNEIYEWATMAKQDLSDSVEESWFNLKSRVHKVNNEILESKGWAPEHPWMNAMIFELMEQRRLSKADKEKYNLIDKKIRREVRYARDYWYRKKCENLEELQRKHDAFNLHKEIKAMVDHKNPVYQLWDNNNHPVLDLTQKKHLWEQYISAMFSDDTRSATPPPCDTDGYPILKDEVTKALNKAKIGKTTGPDDVHIEILKLIEQDNLCALTRLMNLVYDTGVFPEDWLKTIFVTLPKKPNAKRCEDYRTITLMSQVLKSFFTIIHERIRVRCDEQLSDSQFGFRAGVGTREALFAVQVLVQKCKDMQQDVYLCFIDYEKAFDRVLHERLTCILSDIGLDGNDIRVI